MAEIAILGYGTVGSGAYEVLRTNQLSIDKKAAQPIRVKWVFDLREFPGDPVETKLTHNFDDILTDNDVQVVVETMGGLEPAYTYVKKCLMRGKSVVTSNKELVAAHGAELLAIARERNLNFLFEASVGGGIPIIRPLNKSLTADEITEIMGILNGTTNFILTKMTQEGRDFADVLAEAQANGFAEKDPTADVDGHDACRKLAILLSLAMGRHIGYKDIHTEGIRNITMADIAYAKAINGAIKLMAVAKIESHRAFARVTPVIVPTDHPLSVVNDVFNAIFVKGNVIDEVMFYGRGAGKLPTASAVMADVIDAVRHLHRNIMSFWSSERTEVISIDESIVRKLVRVAYDDKKLAMAAVEKLFGTTSIVEVANMPQTADEFAFMTMPETEKTLQEKMNSLKQAAGVKDLPGSIRLERIEAGQ